MGRQTKSQHSSLILRHQLLAEASREYVDWNSLRHACPRQFEARSYIINAMNQSQGRVEMKMVNYIHNCNELGHLQLQQS